MNRQSIPQQVKNTVLSEYSHRCAICGADRPHIHHVDEDPSHNEPLNLLPLCPNCHLNDQHNPTRRHDIQKLALFRKYKDPAILKPQFHPIYSRQAFLASVSPDEAPVSELEKQAIELVELVTALEMGDFYGNRINEMIAPLRTASVFSLNGGSDVHYEQQMRRKNRTYRLKLITNRDGVCALLVEQLRYQRWANGSDADS